MSLKTMLMSEAGATFSPYVLIGVAVAAAVIFGTYKYQDSQIHHYHQLFDKEHDNVVSEHEIIKHMTTAQNTQTKRTEDRIQTKVVTVPGPVKTIIKTIQAAPKPANCGTPAIDILRNNT